MIKLTKAMYDELIAYALRHKPLESCGLIGGYFISDSEIELKNFYPINNVEASTTKYMMDPKEQLLAMKEIRSKQMDLVGIFHSHPHSEAYPSKHDIRLAQYDETAYLIASLENPEDAKLAAFKITNSDVKEWNLELS